MSILSDYKVQLINRPVFGKQIITNNGTLSDYLNDYYYLEAVEALLSDVNDVINANVLEIEIPTQSLYLGIISSSSTKLYRDSEEWDDNNSINPDFELPTVHFKLIVEV